MSEVNANRSSAGEKARPRAARFACVRSDDGIEAATLRLRGRVEAEAADQLQEALLAALGDARLVVLDLHEVEAIDAFGVYAILHANRAAEAEDRRLVVVRAPPEVDDAFRLERGANALTIVDTRVEAAVLPGALDVDVRQVTGAWGTAQRIACRGEIDAATVPQLQAAVATLESGDVIVDLSRTTFMDSTGLSVLLATVGHVVSGDQRVAVVCPPGQVYELMLMTDLVGALYAVADEPAAQRMLAR